MLKKEFVVFGLGHFGKSVALTLAESGCEVLIVDNDETTVQEMADLVTYAVRADVTDAEVLESLGISNFDGAVVGIGENLEASVMVTILAKELGIPYVLAKAKNDLHAKILKKVGADAVVFPEKETGIRIAHNLMMGNFFDAIELSSRYSIMEIDVPDEWSGRSLSDLNLRARFQVNVVGIKGQTNVNINPAPEQRIEKNDKLVVLGDNEQLEALVKLEKNK